MLKRLKSKKGFTLVELLVVMAIIAVLIILIIGAIIITRRVGIETTHRANGKTIQTGIEASFATNKTYPTLAGVDFDSAATTLGVDIVTADCGGGGNVTSTTAGYTITPETWNCVAMTGEDVISVP